MIIIDVPVITLDEEIERLSLLASDDGVTSVAQTRRQYARGAIVALEWVRDRRKLPSDFLDPLWNSTPS